MSSSLFRLFWFALALVVAVAFSWSAHFFLNAKKRGENMQQRVATLQTELSQVHLAHQKSKVYRDYVKSVGNFQKEAAKNQVREGMWAQHQAGVKKQIVDSVSLMKHLDSARSGKNHYFQPEFLTLSGHPPKVTEGEGITGSNSVTLSYNGSFFVRKQP